MSEREYQEPQAFIHPIAPTPGEVEPVENAESLTHKPRGGIWTSTLRGGGVSAWLEWCRSEQWGIAEESRLYRLEPTNDLDVYVIDSYDDVERLMSEWGRDDVHQIFQTKLAPDYEALSDEYDAIHLTAKGHDETRYTSPGTYTWDCESTLWFGWYFEEVVDLGSVGYETERVSDHA